VREALLRIELTDETNQVTVLSMTVSENEFHTLKSEEGIRVDFGEFPAEFIELMKACQQTTGSQTYPRYAYKTHFHCMKLVITVIKYV